MSIGLALTLNIVFIAVIALLAGLFLGHLFRKEHEPGGNLAGGVAAFATACWLTGLSFWGWVIFVVIHFVSKHW